MDKMKEGDNIFQEELEWEAEVNSRNQEIINILGEMNFAICVVNLERGYVNVVHATELIKNSVRDQQLFWEDIFRDKGSSYIDPESWREFVDMFSLSSMRKAWKNGEEKVTMVCRALLDGVWKYISITAFFRESRKQGGYAILTFQDVDEHTRAEIERNRNDQRMAAIIRSRYSILNTVDLETGMCDRVYLEEEYVSGRLETDYSAYIQKALDYSVVEEDKKKFRDAFLLENLRKRARGVRDFKEEQYQYRYKTNPVMWVEEHVLYMRQGDKTIVNILGRDITAEKQTEERARRDIKEKISIINCLSSMFFATYYVNIIGDSFRPVVQKKEVGDILEDERNYTQGINVYAENFISDEDREGYLEHFKLENLRSTLNEEHSFTAYEYRKKQEGNEPRSWIRASVILAEMTFDGKPKRALYVAQDITESKLKQEREQQALREACDAANRANEAKSEFMSRMSHDIRTPMNAIIGMTAIAEKYLEDKERVADCLGKITVSSKHLLSLINEVLDMSKIESGKIDLTEEEINLTELIDNLVTMIRPSMQEKEHRFQVRSTNVKHSYVIGDAVRLQQIFMNILGNAVKYTPKGGDISLEINEKRSNMNGYGHYEFTFSDNGIGMSEEFLKKLFEPFSREEDSRVSKIEGTGLGMTIARNLARMMNGDITVESELGKGTTFIVELSFKIVNVTKPEIEKKEAQLQIDSETPLVGKRVLLVEDNTLNREIAEEVLSSTGVTVESAENGRKALERFEMMPENYYDMILMDIQMPVMNGYEATAAIRKLVRKDAAGIPIIAMTANAFAEDIRMSKQAGMNEHLTKPLDMGQLMQCLQKWLGK